MGKKVQYHVKSGFMAFQFNEKGDYSIGLDCSALDGSSEYEITVGKDEHTTYFITREEIQALMNRYGRDKIVRRRGYKDMYIIPVSEMRRENDYDKLFDF